jgi:23S rRNA (cytidine1920-2'-O)/16S rRNA (cytidine1409-2'-O)-methyltransferase
VDITGWRVADFGCNIGGFTDVCLRRGAAHVTAVDTGYGTLAWTLRNDARVTVMERTNALHAPAPAEPVDLVTIDMAWTPQRLAIPAALRWLSTAPQARIITLVKPHYEVTQDEKRLLKGGALEPDDSRAVCARVLAAMPSLGVRVIAHADSPITGGKTSKKGRGNMEFLALLARTE